MSALQDRRARLLASLYDKFGEPATWTPAAGGAASPVTIRRRSEDGPLDIGSSQALASRDFVRVRKSEAAVVAKHDVFRLETSELLKVMAQPRSDHSGLEWVCEVSEAAP